MQLVILDIELDRLESFLEPAGLHDLRQSDPSVGVSVKNARQQAGKVFGEPPRTAELALVNLLVHGHDVLVMEREIPGHEHKEDDTARPHVGLGAVVPAAAEHFGGHIGRRAAEGVEQAVGTELVGDGGESKVGYLEVPTVVDEEVLGLEVPVEDAAGVAEAHGGDELLEVAARVVLPESALGDAGEELAAADELHDEVDLSLGGHDLEQVHDVRVADAAQHGDLALDVRDEPALDGLLLVEHLDGNAVPGADVPREVHLREGAVPQEAPQLVLPHQQAPGGARPAASSLGRGGGGGGRGRAPRLRRWVRLRRRRDGGHRTVGKRERRLDSAAGSGGRQLLVR